MQRRLLYGLMVCVATSALAWIDYDDRVVRKEPAFGKDFRGLALRLTTQNAEFEQESGEAVVVELQNATEASTLTADAAPDRQHGLLIILADKGGGASLVSQNLLTAGVAKATAGGKITPNGLTEMVRLSFDELAMAAFSEYENGLPSVKPDAARTPGAALVPQIYVMRAILYSALPGKRPDFAIASDSWPILLRPKSGTRMAVAEREAKMKRWLARMSEGAYGGIGVSSQLAALGDVAVGPLIEMAEKADPASEAVRESRIWAIVTLCNTGSPRAEEYILGKLRDPVDFGDLAFLAWHSQALRSPRITATLRQLAEDAACDRPMPWEGRRGPETRRHGQGMLEYVFKHFAALQQSITDATAEGLVRLGDDKVLSFGLLAWKPSSADCALRTLLPLFGRAPVHGNLKKAVLATLAQSATAEGFPVYQRDGDANRQWLTAGLWLHQHQRLDSAALTSALRWLVLDIPRDQEELQAEVIAVLSRVAGPGYPVAGTQPKLPQDWVATWRWALETSGIRKADAIGYCTRLMRTRDELPDAVRLGLLQELKRLIGAEFPLGAGEVDLEAAWPECGNWLVQKGYFGKGAP